MPLKLQKIKSLRWERNVELPRHMFFRSLTAADVVQREFVNTRQYYKFPKLRVVKLDFLYVIVQNNFKNIGRHHRVNNQLSMNVTRRKQLLWMIFVYKSKFGRTLWKNRCCKHSYQLHQSTVFSISSMLKRAELWQLQLRENNFERLLKQCRVKESSGIVGTTS